MKIILQIERERSKERLENKRRQDQLKKVYDEEKEEKKKKLSEVIEIVYWLEHLYPRRLKI